jgi:hypothetical protein
MSGTLAGLALRSLQKDHWWYDRVNENKHVNENENKWNGTKLYEMVHIELGLSTSLDPRVSHAFISLFIPRILIQ